jgi:hypothetical protein
MMLMHEIRGPEIHSGGGEMSLPAALKRALEAARGPGSPPSQEPWRVYPLDDEQVATLAWLAARQLEPTVGREDARAAYEQWRAIPGWVVITCIRSQGEEQIERDREATLSAAQRASLSLWSDNIPSNWAPDLVADEPEFFEVIGADGGREVPVGVLLYGHPDK